MVVNRIGHKTLEAYSRLSQKDISYEVWFLTLPLASEVMFDIKNIVEDELNEWKK